MPLLCELHVELAILDCMQLNVRELPVETEDEEHVVFWRFLDADDSPAHVPSSTDELAHLFACCPRLESVEVLPAKCGELAEFKLRGAGRVHEVANALADAARAVASLGAAHGESAPHKNGNEQRAWHVTANV